MTEDEVEVVARAMYLHDAAATDEIPEAEALQIWIHEEQAYYKRAVRNRARAAIAALDQHRARG